MLKLAIIEESAALRSELLNKIGGYLKSKIAGLEQIPKISLLPLSPAEARFNAEPDMAIIGENFATSKLNELRELKSTWPNTAVIVQISDLATRFSSLTSLAAMGIDDTLSSDASPAEFLSKLLIISQRSRKNKKGKMILIDSGKGGLGVTSITAGLGEALFEKGQKTLIVDFDYETQDLCRFLQARPYVNHNLYSLLKEERPITSETVMDCLVPVWVGEENFYCMAPFPKEESLQNSNQTRALLSVLEVCDQIFDAVIIDVGCLKGAMLNTLYRVCDGVLFVVSNDPAALYPSVARYKKISTVLPLNVRPKIIINAARKEGLNNKILTTEFNLAAHTEEGNWSEQIPYADKISRWPGSKLSPYSLGGQAVKKNILRVLTDLSLLEKQADYPEWLQFICRIAKTSLALPAPLKALPLPQYAPAIENDQNSSIGAATNELPSIELSYIGQSENLNRPVEENFLRAVS